MQSQNKYDTKANNMAHDVHIQHLSLVVGSTSLDRHLWREQNIEQIYSFAKPVASNE